MTIFTQQPHTGRWGSGVDWKRAGALGVTPPITILHQLFNLSSFQLPHLSNGESHSRDCCEDEINYVYVCVCVYIYIWLNIAHKTTVNTC